MKLVVIESPIKGNFTRHKRYALWCAHHCYTQDEAAYASHLFYPQFLDDRDLRQRTFGMAAGLAWAAKADLRAFYTDLGWSNGMIAAATALGLTYEDGGVSGPVALLDKYDLRILPQEMYEQFEAGFYPPATPGWENPLHDPGALV